MNFRQAGVENLTESAVAEFYNVARKWSVRGALAVGICESGPVPHVWVGARGNRQSFKSAGTLPPLAANLFMTCLCSQMFMAAESPASPA